MILSSYPHGTKFDKEGNEHKEIYNFHNFTLVKNPYSNIQLSVYKVLIRIY